MKEGKKLQNLHGFRMNEGKNLQTLQGFGMKKIRIYKICSDLG